MIEPTLLGFSNYITEGLKKRNQATCLLENIQWLLDSRQYSKRWDPTSDIPSLGLSMTVQPLQPALSQANIVPSTLPFPDFSARQLTIPP